MVLCAGQPTESGNVNDTTKQLKNSTLSVYLYNRPGALMRISQVFARRGYNIDSLVVSQGRDAHLSRMTIGLSGEAEGITQIIKQVNKLIDVITCTEHERDDTIVKELVLIKLEYDSDDYGDIAHTVQAIEGRIVDISNDYVIASVHGNPEKVDLALRMLSRFTIVETTRTGKIAMSRRSEHT